jgi:hypothetical protein
LTQNFLFTILILSKSEFLSNQQNALASYWVAKNKGGVSLVKAADIMGMLGAGSRAFNLRVPDPYLLYQKQGPRFTRSFFTPKDKQDVHGLPAVEI